MLLISRVRTTTTRGGRKKKWRRGSVATPLVLADQWSVAECWKLFVRAISHSDSAAFDVIPCAQPLSGSPQPVNHTTLAELNMLFLTGLLTLSLNVSYSYGCQLKVLEEEPCFAASCSSGPVSSCSVLVHEHYARVTPSGWMIFKKKKGPFEYYWVCPSWRHPTWGKNKMLQSSLLGGKFDDQIRFGIIGKELQLFFWRCHRVSSFQWRSLSVLAAGWTSWHSQNKVYPEAERFIQPTTSESPGCGSGKMEAQNIRNTFDLVQ